MRLVRKRLADRYYSKFGNNMSKIGKRIVSIPDGVTVTLGKEAVEVKGPNATLSVPTLPGIKIEMKDGALSFTPEDDLKQTESNWGTMRALVRNAIEGSKTAFTKTLMIEGVGYKAVLEGDTLVLSLGFSHPVKFPIPEGIKIEVEGGTLKISGASRAMVGEVAANIRRHKKPEPYKGKGIRYSDEVVKRKSGKKAVGSGG